MKKNVIFEIDRMKEMMGLINEQTTIGQCSGSNEISNPVVDVLEMSQDGNSVKFRLKGFFGASKTESDSYTSMLTKLKNTIISKLDKASSPEGYELKFINIESAIGSASNYYNGPLRPTNDNKGKLMNLDVLYKQEPYKDIRKLHGGDPKKFDSDTETNMGFASQRVSKFLKHIQETADKTGISLSENFTQSKISPIITDTGGCIDEKRDSSKYPNPGQYVDLTGLVQIKKNPAKCLEGLKVVVGYFQSEKVVDGIKFGKNSKSHSCAFATFNIFANGVPIGISNMNNITEEYYNSDNRNPKIDWNVTRIGIQDTSTQKRFEFIEDGSEREKSTKPFGKQGWTVYTVIDVPNDKLREIASKSTDGMVNLVMTPNSKSALRDGKAHGDAPMVAAYKINNGKVTVFYGPKEPYEGKGDVNTAVQIGSFTPCK